VSGGDGCWHLFQAGVVVAFVAFLAGTILGLNSLFFVGDRTTSEYRAPDGRCTAVVRERTHWLTDEDVAIKECR